ncbi:hypothetical protein YB2330_005188 [Saitoella coloradoensis]
MAGLKMAKERFDADAYLKKQGWKGVGNALKEGGLARPILTSKKFDTLGLGKKTKASAQADTWWDSVFNSQLKNLSVSSSSTGTVVLDQKLSVAKNGAGLVSAQATMVNAVKGGGWENPLYKAFVRGSGLQGTFTPPSQLTSTESGASSVEEKPKSKKRSRDDDDSISSKKSKKSRSSDADKSAKKLAKEARKAAEKEAKKAEKRRLKDAAKAEAKRLKKEANEAKKAEKKDA